MYAPGVPGEAGEAERGGELILNETDPREVNTKWQRKDQVRPRARESEPLRAAAASRRGRKRRWPDARNSGHFSFPDIMCK